MGLFDNTRRLTGARTGPGDGRGDDGGALFVGIFRAVFELVGSIPKSIRTIKGTKDGGHADNDKA